MAVIVNIVAVVQGKYTNKLGFLAVFPLALLLFTGLYLFVLPYRCRPKRGRTMSRSEGNAKRRSVTLHMVSSLDGFIAKQGQQCLLDG